MVNWERISKVAKSMARIKSVLHERELAYQAATDPTFAQRNKARRERNYRKKRSKTQALRVPVVKPVRQIGLHHLAKKTKWRNIKPRVVETETQAQTQEA